MPLRALDFESSASANSAKGPHELKRTESYTEWRILARSVALPRRHNVAMGLG